MPIKIPVVDRVPTYPGRVVMTPVVGQANTYDMVRADVPVTEGTPINKALLDSKAYALTEDVTVYVANSGNDVSGDGTSGSPYATIQKAVNELPKYLDGHVATISIGIGVYPERVEINGFCGGRLVVSRPGELAIVTGGITITNSSHVEVNVYQIDAAGGSTLALLWVKDGSSVAINSDIILDGLGGSMVGLTATNNSRVSSSKKITVNGCGGAISAEWCSFVSVTEVSGNDNIFGVAASQGGIVSYKTDSIVKMWSNVADTGGLVLTGANSTNLSGATIEL